MNRENINNALRFIGLILLQIIVLNNINFLGYINPLFYIIFVFLFPITLFKTGILIKAINKVAAALIPPESENTSMHNPIKKLKTRIMASSFLKG